MGVKHKLISILIVFPQCCARPYVEIFFCPHLNKKLPVLVHTQQELVFTWICSGVHWSRLTDLTLEMWTPRLRWIPAQRIHMNTPRFQEAHRGPETGEKLKVSLGVRSAGTIFKQHVCQARRGINGQQNLSEPKQVRGETHRFHRISLQRGEYIHAKGKPSHISR